MGLDFGSARGAQPFKGWGLPSGPATTGGGIWGKPPAFQPPTGGGGMIGPPQGGLGAGGGFPIGGPAIGAGGGWQVGGKSPLVPQGPKGWPGASTTGQPGSIWGQGWNPAWGIWNLLTGNDPNQGGPFSLNPPQAIMDAIRQQGIADAGAQERSARLGLQARGDVDPSTYGFQALQSQLGGQARTSQALNQANLGLRQGQLEQYWNMLQALLREASASDRAKLQPQGGGGFDWGGLLGGLGNVAGAVF